MNRLQAVIGLWLLLFSTILMAGKDPIGWRLNQPFPDPVFTIGGGYNITYTFTNQLPFKLAKALQIEKSASPGTEFSFTDQCSGKLLNANESCTVLVTLDPIIVGNKSLQLIIAGYSKDRVPLPTLRTTATGGTNLTIQGLLTQALPATLSVSQAGSYTVTFTNTSAQTATGVSIESNNINYTTTCGITLAAGQSCTVNGTYTPVSTSPAVQTITTRFVYTQGNSVAVDTSTNVTAQTGLVGTLVPPNFLPPIMVGGPGNIKTIQYLFTNYSNVTATITSTDVTISEIGAVLTPVSNTCSGGATLLPGQACQITVTFEAPVADIDEVIPYTITGEVTATLPPDVVNIQVPTSTIVVNAISSTRTLNFENLCNFDVWYSLNGGAIPNSPSCQSDADCPNGSHCNPNSALCYWYNFGPSDGLYHLDAQGGGHSTSSVTILNTNLDATVLWSGNISASLNCDGSSSCSQASCQNQGGSLPCAPGIGFNQPATQAEITMLVYNADSYDVEVINGFHLPIKMAPDNTVTAANYSCGVPGNESASNGFGACNWSNISATLPDNAYYWVTAGGAACGAGHSACAANQICGLDSNLNEVCGNFLGYWTANQACAVNSARATPFFQCNDYLLSPYPNNQYNFKQLMACSVPSGATSPLFNSCYLNYAGQPASAIQQCCGCQDWWTIGIGANSNTQSCTQPGQSSPQTNPQWNSFIQPGIQWLKKACPSIYTYPFDDKTSGFTCTNNTPAALNSVGYTITFCAGSSGLPSGKTEGRG